MNNNERRNHIFLFFFLKLHFYISKSKLLPIPILSLSLRLSLPISFPSIADFLLTFSLSLLCSQSLLHLRFRCGPHSSSLIHLWAHRLLFLHANTCHHLTDATLAVLAARRGTKCSSGSRSDPTQPTVSRSPANRSGSSPVAVTGLELYTSPASAMSTRTQFQRSWITPPLEYAGSSNADFETPRLHQQRVRSLVEVLVVRASGNVLVNQYHLVELVVVPDQCHQVPVQLRNFIVHSPASKTRACYPTRCHDHS